MKNFTSTSRGTQHAAETIDDVREQLAPSKRPSVQPRANVEQAAPAKTLDDVRNRIKTVRTRAAVDLLDYFRTHEHFAEFARAFNRANATLGEFGTSLVPSVGERGAFRLSQKTGGLYYSVCRFRKGKKKEKKKFYDRFFLPHLYAITHGYDPKEELSKVMLLTWTRRLLHDSGVLAVPRTKFRTPQEGCMKQFMSAKQLQQFERDGNINGMPANWPLAVALLEGIGLLLDFEPDRDAKDSKGDPTRWVPYAAEFAAKWIRHERELYLLGVQEEHAVHIILKLRQKLIKTGLLAYKPEKPGSNKSKYRPALLSEGKPGNTADELLLGKWC